MGLCVPFQPENSTFQLKRYLFQFQYFLLGFGLWRKDGGGDFCGYVYFTIQPYSSNVGFEWLMVIRLLSICICCLAPGQGREKKNVPPYVALERLPNYKK